MDSKELLGKRVLLVVKPNSFAAGDVSEYKVLEVADSGNWIKLQDMCGKKFWKAVTMIQFIEELKPLTTPSSPKDLT